MFRVEFPPLSLQDEISNICPLPPSSEAKGCFEHKTLHREVTLWQGIHLISDGWGALTELTPCLVRLQRSARVLLFCHVDLKSWG